MKLSFEFFPPRNPAQQRRFWRTLGCLETLSPDFISVTWGAQGTDQQASFTTLTELQSIDTPVAAHLTCAGQRRDSMRNTLDQLFDLGIEHIVALRGDNADSAQSTSGAMTHAIDLVKLIREHAAVRQHQVQISVAAYPETHPDASSAREDLIHLHDKLDAGADRALTQFFFCPDQFLSWRDEARAVGITKPLIPGILPIHNLEKIRAFGDKCGAQVPKKLIERFSRFKDKQSLQQLAIEHAYELCQTLHQDGVDSFHLYTLNQSDLAWRVSCLLKGHDRLQDLLLEPAA